MKLAVTLIDQSDPHKGLRRNGLGLDEMHYECVNVNAQYLQLIKLEKQSSRVFESLYNLFKIKKEAFFITTLACHNRFSTSYSQVNKVLSIRFKHVELILPWCSQCRLTAAKINGDFRYRIHAIIIRVEEYVTVIHQ